MGTKGVGMATDQQDEPKAGTPPGEGATTGPRLKDCPDWYYLIREFEVLYRQGSAGGSRSIRSHRKRVREAVSAVLEANPEMAVRAPEAKPVTAHLGRALDLSLIHI